MTDTRQVLEEAWEHLCQTSLSFRRYACTTIPGGDGWTMTGKFCRFLDAEAWTDAALMLVQGPAEYPDSKTFLIDCAMQTSVHSQPVAYVWDERGKHMGKGKTPAHALLAACLKARENGDG